MNENERKRIEMALSDKVNSDCGSDKKDKYYVYGIIADEELIYIGKGVGDRVYAHEDETQYIIDRINEDDELTKTEKESAIKNCNSKIVAIKEAKKVERLIIKYGLTEKEAYMAESSLINLCNYINDNEKSIKELTNIVNGHASDREKQSRIHTTEAMTTADFLENVAVEQIRIFEDDSMKEKKIVFLKVDNAIKSYAELYPDKNCYLDNEIVYNCTYGFWNLSMDKVKDAKYVFALSSKGIVRGIYKPTKWYEMKDYPLDKLSGTDVDFRKNNKKEIEILSSKKDISEIINDLKNINSGLVKDKDGNFKNQINKRIGFYCEDISEENLEDYVKGYIGKEIVHYIENGKNYFSYQNSKYSLAYKE